MTNSRCIGTTVRGIRCPIIRENDNLVKITVDSVLSAAEQEHFELHDKDVIAITESVLARSQGNYCTVDDIATDIRNKTANTAIGVIFPIYSRNRFSVCLKGIARAAKKVILMLNYPADEVGNTIIPTQKLKEFSINPYTDLLTLNDFYCTFGKPEHIFTHIDYIQLYKQIIEGEGAEAEIIFCNDPGKICIFTDTVINCSIHNRSEIKSELNYYYPELTVLNLTDIMDNSINGSGYNFLYGLLGSNKVTDDTLKLFPRSCSTFCREVQNEILKRTDKHIEVMIYGDGGFKDPVGGIWELADPIICPGCTQMLHDAALPNELKLKYLADNDYRDLSGKNLDQAIINAIENKDEELGTSMLRQGTTPRRIPDLLGSLADLTSGSGDKGTPIVLIQGYFDNYATN